MAEFGAEALTSLPAQLTMAQLDPFQPHTNNTLEVVEGNSVAVSCDAPYSNPPPVIQFYKDGRPIEPETGNMATKTLGVNQSSSFILLVQQLRIIMHIF